MVRVACHGGPDRGQLTVAGGSKSQLRLAEIAALERAETVGQEQIRLLRGAAGGGNGLLVAAAAKAARRHALRDLVPDLTRAFMDLLGRPAKLDKGCLAKQALIEALNALDCPQEEPLLRGVRYRQYEPAYGGTIETAARVRAECAMGLARVSHPQAAREVLPLLVDPEPEARAGAVRALAFLGGEAGDLLLRLKALIGDEHPAVVGECLSALAKIDPAGSVEFIAGFLDSKDAAVVEEAAMALASMRGAQSAEILRAARTSRADPGLRDRLLLPIAMTRCDEAIDALEAVILDEPADSAAAAVKAAALNRHDAHWRERIQKAVSLRAAPKVSLAFQKEFGAPA
jgi:hypothetical protein